jgi:uncharacterized protein (DUF58 family)
MRSFEIEPGVNAQTILRTGDLEVSALSAGTPVEVDSKETRDATLTQRRPLYLIALILALLSIPFGQSVLLLAGALVFALAFVPEVWYRWGLRALAISRHPSSNRAEFGDVVEVVVTVENRKPLPLPWLEIDDESAEALLATGPSVHPTSGDGRVLLRQTVAIWAYQRLRRRFSLHATARGVYAFGPMTVRLTDPFGILEREAKVRAFDYLLVHPLVAPLQRFGLPSNAPFGERKSPTRLLEDPLRIAGVREYAQGDEPRRIHWKATARTGTLQSKIYEPATRHSLIVLLDVRTLSNPLMGYDPNLVELAITAAASVATWANDQRYAVGMHSNGTQALADADETGPTGGAARADYVERFTRAAPNLRLRIPVSNGSGQPTRILDGLARLLPYYGLPMDQLIAAELPHLPFGATVVYIGTESVVDVPLIVALRQLKLRGHAVTLLLTTNRSDEAGQADPTPHFAGLPTHTIGDRALWDELVTDVLGPQTTRRNAAARSLRVPGVTDPAQNPSATDAHPPAGVHANSALNGPTNAAIDRADNTAAHSALRKPRPLVVE